jgi:hypothetical protein
MQLITYHVIGFFRNIVQIHILIYVQILTPMNTYAHPISMSIFERLSRLDFEIYKISHQEHLIVDRDVTSH